MRLSVSLHQIMNRFLYYDLDRFACVRIPTQIEINITIQI